MLIKRISKKLSNIVLQLIGWKMSISHPIPKKCIIVGAPHTSNWDLIFALLLIGASQIKFYWIGKEEAFQWPIVGYFLGRLGGIPVKRKTRNNFVDQVAEKFRERDELRIAITPEGTRSKTGYWKSGFYYMALNSDVPIVLGYIDYGKKVVGLGPCFFPVGDIHSDFKILQNFYSDKVGFNPHKMGKILLKSDI